MYRHGLSILVCSGLLWGCSTVPQTRITHINDRAVEYSLQGRGTPVVVFEAGLGADLDTWKDILPAITHQATTLSYSRSGYGNSDAGPYPRNGTQVVTELRQLLQDLNLKPPYILVGHSLGGLFMQLYARQYPNEVAGLVLVDSSHPDQYGDLRAQTDSSRLLWNGIIRNTTATGMNTLRAEYAAIPQTIGQYNLAGDFPPIPLTVLTATNKPTRLYGHTQRTWLDLQMDMARMSPRGRHVIAAQSRHNIHLEQPELVITAIREMARQPQTQQGPISGNIGP